ncbi:MAG: toprim domain-containing protein [Thermoproteota archaeon]|jgi:5S rRNA maturation endonuclease (ribonuclease M5)
MHLVKQQLFQKNYNKRINFDDVNKIMKLVEYLVSLDESSLILVEGKKDAVALKSLGTKAEIFQVKGRNFSKLICKLQEEGRRRRVIIMPDFDRKGEEKYQQWSKALRGIAEVDYFTWKKFRVLVTRNVKDIEGLPRLVEKIKYSNFSSTLTIGLIGGLSPSSPTS